MATRHAAGNMDLVPLVRAPVPQMVDQLVDVLKILGTTLRVVPEQVIEAPKISLQDSIPQGTAIRSSQMAGQLVEVSTVVSRSFFQQPWCVGRWRSSRFSRLTGSHCTSYYS